MKGRILPSIFALLITLTVDAQNVQKQVKILDDFIQEAIKVWTPPGLAVAVIKNGEIVFIKGYGTTSLENGTPVDEHTLFVCASTTKAFTAASLAMLVDDGKVNWNDKVIDYLPNFQLYDPYMTREITVRDLLTHRTGLGNTDYLWTRMNISGDSALYKMREVKPVYSMRSSFIYQNLMYLAAGRVIEVASGITWESFLQERIYKPLGMNESYPLHSMVLDKPNKAEAHFKIEDKIVRIDQLTADEIGPAGSMWASISDMAKWMQFLSNDAVINGDTLISPTNFMELFRPQQIIPADQFYPTARVTKPNWMTYGLGWFQHDYRGNIVQFHTGSLPGMVAIAGLMPEENVAVYVMGNLDHVELRHAIIYTTFDLFMDGKITTDWSTDLKSLYDGLAQDDEEEPKRVSGTKPSADDVIGIYLNDIYGKIEVSRDGDVFLFNLNNKVKGKLTHWHYDTYQVEFDIAYYGTSMINIRLDSEANISYMETFGEKFNYVPSKD